MQFERMLRSDDRRDFNSAVVGLSSIPKQQAVALLESLAHAPDGTFRSRALDGLGKISPERAQALAIRLLDDPEWFVRVDSINTLHRFGNFGSTPLIARLLASDGDELVRSWAAFALGHLGDASVLPVLEVAAAQDTGTDHEGRSIRETALKSIEQIRSREHAEGKSTTDIGCDEAAEEDRAPSGSP